MRTPEDDSHKKTTRLFAETIPRGVEKTHRNGEHDVYSNEESHRDCQRRDSPVTNLRYTHNFLRLPMRVARRSAIEFPIADLSIEGRRGTNEIFHWTKPR